jgi:ketosteroid isomerase-like protein
VNLADRIRLGFDRFNERDWEALQRGLREDFEAIDRVPPDELHARGPDAMRQITEANGEVAFADLRMEVLEIEVRELGEDRALTLVRIHAAASGGASGAPVDAEIGQLWTFEDGVATRMEQFRTWEEARRAATASSAT